MVKEHLNKIFLSASIPYPEREFYDSADILAIRDSIRAIATVAIPKSHLIYGGHPAITPLINEVMIRMNSSIKDHITLYQSQFFRNRFPNENVHFENLILTEELQDQQSSLDLLRNEMIAKNSFSAGIFIGGMQGVLDEYILFKKTHPNALILPVASTGAAAELIYKEADRFYDPRLKHDYAFMALFRDLLSEHLKA